MHMQGSPQDKMKARLVGVVWAEFVTTWFPHQRNRAMEGMGGHYAERAWGEHCVMMYTCTKGLKYY